MEKKDILFVKGELNKLLSKIEEMQESKKSEDREEFNKLKRECLEIQENLGKSIR